MAMFSGVGNHTVERRHLKIQKAMIERLDDLALEDVLEFLQVEDHAGDGVRLAFQRHFHDEVVAVAARIGFGPVEGLVLLVGQRAGCGTRGKRENSALRVINMFQLL